MLLNLNSYLGVPTQALTLEAQRTELLASNLANADTPNYKARDIDFKAAMAAAAGPSSGSTSPTGTLALTPAGGPLTLSPPGGLGGSGVVSGSADTGVSAGTRISTDAGTGASGGLTAATLKYRTPLAPSLDGNTVDEQLEQSAFAENSVRYQATLTILNSRLRTLMTAITGQ